MYEKIMSVKMYILLIFLFILTSQSIFGVEFSFPNKGRTGFCWPNINYIEVRASENYWTDYCPGAESTLVGEARLFGETLCAENKEKLTALVKEEAKCPDNCPIMSLKDPGYYNFCISGTFFGSQIFCGVDLSFICAKEGESHEKWWLASSASSFFDVFPDLVATYNKNIDKVPGIVTQLFGNERIKLVVERDEKRELTVSISPQEPSPPYECCCIAEGVPPGLASFEQCVKGYDGVCASSGDERCKVYQTKTITVSEPRVMTVGVNTKDGKIIGVVPEKDLAKPTISIITTQKIIKKIQDAPSPALALAQSLNDGSIKYIGLTADRKAKLVLARMVFKFVDLVQKNPYLLKPGAKKNIMYNGQKAEIERTNDGIRVVVVEGQPDNLVVNNVGTTVGYTNQRSQQLRAPTVSTNAGIYTQPYNYYANNWANAPQRPTLPQYGSSPYAAMNTGFGSGLIIIGGGAGSGQGFALR